jgi:hypothetical protein
VTGLALGRLAGGFRFVKRRFQALTLAASASLAFFGGLLIFNRLTTVTVTLQRAFDAIGLGRLVRLG